MLAVHRHVVSDDVAVTDEVVVLDGRFAEIPTNDLEDLLPPFAPLRAGGMVDHVFRYELIDNVSVACRSAAKELFDYLACVGHVPWRVSHPGIFASAAAGTGIVRA